MSTSVVLPALGESVTEGTVTRWLKKVGDTVEADEGLLEISTDKVDTEIPSPVGGVIEEILVQEDETVEVGAVLAKIGDGSALAAAPATRPPPSRRAPSAAPAAEAPRPQRARPAEPRRRPRLPGRAAAAPATRKDVVLPELGESVTEGTVTRWLKQVGDSVEVDEPLLEISTDKVDTEIPSPVRRHARRRSSSARTRPSPSAPRSPASAPAPPAPAAAQLLRPAAAGPRAGTRSGGTCARSRGTGACRRARSGARRARPPQPLRLRRPLRPRRPTTPMRPYVTPLVRRLAQQQGVDLATRHRHRRRRTHPQGGRAQGRRDGRGRAAAAAAPAAPAAPAPVEVSPLRGTTQPMSRLRKVLAERAVASMQQTAQLTTVVEVDVTKLANYRDAGARPTSWPRPATSCRSCRSSRSPPPRRSRRTRSSTRRSTATDIVYPAVREHLDRRRHRARPAHPGAARRGIEEPRADRARDRRPRRPHAQQQAQARRAGRRHVHADQHRFARRAVRHARSSSCRSRRSSAPASSSSARAW